MAYNLLTQTENVPVPLPSAAPAAKEEAPKKRSAPRKKKEVSEEPVMVEPTLPFGDE